MQLAGDQVFEGLEERIVAGIIPAGSKLDEQQIADEFSVSRTPVREALARLSAAKLIEKRQGTRGYFAKAPSFTLMIEMFEVMAELEGMCARLAARRMSAGRLADLREANQTCQAAIDAGDPDLYYQNNVDFHEVIYSSCGNGFLAEETRAIRRRLRSFRKLQLRVRGRMNQSLAEHLAILDAIEVGDEELAYRLSKDHVAIQGERFGDLISQLEN